MTEQLQLSESDRSGARLLAIRGELDVATAHLLGDKLNILLGEHSSVELDMSGLSFIDSTGLGVLVRATEVADQSGRDLTIGALSEPVMRVVELTGLSERLHLATRLD